jgi:hypothetical protein
MAFRALVTVGTTDLPTPSTYIGTEATIVDSARNVQGYVVGAIVRESVAKVEMTWNYLPAETWSAIMKMFNTAYGGKFYNDVTFFNQLTSDWATRKMYVGDRTTSGAFMTNPETGAIKGYTNPKLSLIEL